MSTVGSGSPSPAAAAPASAVADRSSSSSSWAPHGTVLTAFVVSINLLVILLIIFFFWRFFSGKPQGASAGAEDDDDEDDALPVASPWATRRYRRRGDAPRKEVDVASSLPVHVYSSAAAAAGGKAVECAVCIVELCDGDAARLLPRCGHQFHADCVGEWLRLHATCPLCRARVVAPAAAGAAAEPVNPKDAVGEDSPV